MNAVVGSLFLCAVIYSALADIGLTTFCSNLNYELVPDPTNNCGPFECRCTKTSCENGESYCPCPFPYADTSDDLDGSTCGCLFANACGTTCPRGYYGDGNTCKLHTDTGSYSITLVNLGYDSSYNDYFEAAAARWESIITGDVTDVEEADGSWFADFADYSQPVDDVVIGYTVEYIDGYGGTLGMAGPIYFLDDIDDPYYGTPVSGIMIFDSYDVYGLIYYDMMDAVVMHEMGHVLGFGTNWPTASNCASSCDRYDQYATGTCFASIEYESLGLSDVLRVESEGTIDDGTYCAHWSEDLLGYELMTGLLDYEITYNPLTSISIAAMADLGYLVDYSQAEPLEDPESRELAKDKPKYRRLRTDMRRPVMKGISELTVPNSAPKLE